MQQTFRRTKTDWKMRPGKILMAALTATLFILAGCGKASLETIYNNQETKIESFINSLASKTDSLRVEHNAGSHRAIVAEGTGDYLEEDGNIAFYYAGYTFNGNVSPSGLFATNSSEVAAGAGFKLEADQAVPVTVKLSEAGLVSGLRNGLKGVRGGEECYIVFSGKYGFGKKAFGTIPANSALVYHVWVESISND